MALILGCQELGKSYSGRRLFEGLTLAIQDGDRIGLVGPNGAGKTTLLRILEGHEPADEGGVNLRRGARLVSVAQAPTFVNATTVEAELERALEGEVHDPAEVRRLVGQTLGRCGFVDPTVEVDTLSGGWRKRLAIACALARTPDLLLLDEPTNHLDLEGVLWLEEVILSARFATVIVSHDRYLLERCTTRMLEVSHSFPGGTFLVEGNYSTLLEKKEAYFASEAKREEGMRSRMRRELEWLRRGPKARTTKAKARIDAAGELQAELTTVGDRRKTSKTTIEFDSTGRKTKQLLVGEGLTLRRGGQTLFEDLNLVLKPGLCLGLVGPNGCGKTSLLSVLRGELKPDKGIVRPADKLRVVYFDQHREGLDPDQSLRRALAPEGDLLVFRGESIHVAGWAQRFQFRADRLDIRVGMLSGGEIARVHIARLMLQPADLLLLDEPTNDLDIGTLEVLEESLETFPGAIVLVTHDRYLLERLTHAVIGFDEGVVGVFADYAQWDADRKERRRSARSAPTAAAGSGGRSGAPAAGAKRLTYKEQKEWAGLTAAIARAEAAERQREAALTDPAIAADATRLTACYGEFEKAKAEVARLYERWAELEAKQTG